MFQTLKKLITDEKWIKKIFIFFIMIQSLLDFNILFNTNYIFIFGFAIPTLVRLIIIFYAFLIFLFKNQKDAKYIFIYGLFILIYTIVHCITIKYINNLPTYSSFSLFQEFFYILRMLLPLFTAYIAYKLKLTKKEFSLVITFLTLSVSLTIIISNLLKISLVAYTYKASTIIKDNLFAWFSPTFNGYHPKEIASIGFFHTANQISGLLILLLPLNFYIFFKMNNKQIIVITLQIIAMMLLGTRTGVLGWILASILMTIIYLYFIFIKHELNINKKKILYLTTTFILTGFIAYFCPIVNNYDSYNIEASETNDLERYAIMVGKKVEDLSTFEKLPFINVKTEFYKNIYTYDEFSEFWSEVTKLPYAKRVGNRNMQLLITHDIDKQNHNLITALFGYSYTAFTSIGLYLERDIIVHYYTIGIIGIILLIGPYILLLSHIGIKMLKNYKEKFNITNTSIVSAITMLILVSLLTGHLLDELTITIVLGFVCGYLLINQEEN